MNYVDSFNLFGTEAAQIPCIKGAGAPTTSTQGAVGCFYMDTNTGDVYKCIAAGVDTYTWVSDIIPLDARVFITEQNIAEIAAAPGDGQVVNLFDKDSPNVLKNHFFGSTMADMPTHSEQPLNSYHISDYIPVKEGRRYTTNRDGVGYGVTAASPPSRSFWYYDEDKNPISRPAGDYIEGVQYYTTTAPKGAKYARIDFFSTGATIMFVEGDIFPDEYMAYDQELLQKVVLLPLAKEYEQKLKQDII